MPVFSFFVFMNEDLIPLRTGKIKKKQKSKLGFKVYGRFTRVHSFQLRPEPG